MNNKRRRGRKKKKIFLKKKIEFFNENKGIKIFCITLIAMISFYIIYSIKSIDKNNKKSIIFIDELYNIDSLLNMTKFVILKSFNYLTNPF